MMKAIIVDDERHARQKLRMLLADARDVEIVRECVNGSEAVAAIRELRPELVFLDIQMPGMDGFEVGRDVVGEGGVTMRSIIFVTAHDRYAVRAFEVQALDYILKPFDRARFELALQRARDRLAEGK